MAFWAAAVTEPGAAAAAPELAGEEVRVGLAALPSSSAYAPPKPRPPPSRPAISAAATIPVMVRAGLAGGGVSRVGGPLFGGGPKPGPPGYGGRPVPYGGVAGPA